MKVLVTRPLPNEAIEMLKKKFDVTLNAEDRPLTRQELLDGLKGKDGVLCLLTDKMNAEAIGANPQLKIIANYAVGYDNIDVKAATANGIPVSNTPGVLTDATAELAWSLLFSAARRIPESDRFTRDGKFKGWGPMMLLGRGITGKTLGIIGAGRIGAAFALKSKGFNMNVVYYEAAGKNEVLEKELGAKKVDLPELLKNSDFVSIHVPLTPETKHLIGEKELKMMKPTAVLVNTARGPIVDEKALAKALKEKWIFAAGLDVYENEPKIEEELLKLENAVLVPHIGSATVETRTRMATLAAENIIAALENKIPPTCVNPDFAKLKKSK
ncbi:MAG: D-glycerate dehydrogenase [Candidatus Thermoplasmatota archaeon]|nr:D-glycerate dehydrogenase [Candidatus Thermoplasmatota archaeon]